MGKLKLGFFMGNKKRVKGKDGKYTDFYTPVGISFNKRNFESDNPVTPKALLDDDSSTEISETPNLSKKTSS